MSNQITRKLHLVNNQLFSRLNIHLESDDDEDNSNVTVPDNVQEQAQSTSATQKLPTDQSPFSFGGALKNIVQKHDFNVFLSSHSGSINETTHVAAALTPTAAVVKSQKPQQPVPPLLKEKSRAILTAVLQTANKVTPAMSLKRSVDKNKQMVLTPSISAMYTYLLSGVMLEPDEKKVRSQMILLSRSFGITNESDHLPYVQQAAQLSRYHLAELAYNMSTSPHTVSEPKSPRQMALRARQKLVQSLPVHQALLIITVDSATGLKIKDKASGSSDPYVCIHLTEPDEKCVKSKSSHQYRTSVKHSNLSPEWNETFVIKTTSPSDNTLILTVFDSDLVTKDDFMGTVHIPMSDAAILPLSSVTCDFYLQHREAKQNFFSRLVGSKEVAKKEDTESGDQSLGTIKMTYFYVCREISKEDTFDAVPEDIKKLIKINHDQHMAELVEYYVSTPYFKSSFIFPEELHQMLKDFEQRVGISSITRLTTIIDQVVNIFSISHQHLRLVNTTLGLLQNDLIQDKSVTLSSEMSIKLATSTSAIKEIFKKVITKYGLSFPVNMNEKGEITGITEENSKLLTLSIDILRQLYAIRCFQKGKPNDPSKFKARIDKYIMNYFRLFFSMVKENSEVSIETSSSFDNVVGLLDVYDAIELQMTNDADIYAKFFDNEYTKNAVIAYYSLLKLETLEILSKENTVCMETFALLKKIQKLHSTVLKPYMDEFQVMDLDNLFGPFVDMWIDEARTQFSTWMTRSLQREKWDSIDAKNKILHSDSVMDLFHMFEIGKNHLVGTNINVDKQMLGFISLVSQCYKDYLDSVMNTVLMELGDNDWFLKDNNKNKHGFDKFLSIFSPTSSSTPSRERSDSVTKNVSVNLSMCVKLNCIETSRQLLDDFIEDLSKKFPALQDKIEESFAKSVSYAKKQIEYLTDLVIGKIGMAVTICIDEVISKSDAAKGFNSHSPDSINPLDEAVVSEMLQPLFGYLTTELSLLSRNLYQPTFSRFIRGVWMCIWKECERNFFPYGSLQKITDDAIIKQVYMIFSIYNQLESFFYADGDGVRLELLRTLATPLISMLPAFFCSTASLIDLHKQLVGGSMSASVSVSSVTELTVSVSKLPSPPTQFNLPEFKSESSKLVIGEVHIMSPLASRQKDSEASKYVKLHTKNYKNRYLIERFDLPNQSLTIIEKYKCRSSLGIPTILYLVDDHLCISTILSYSETNTAIKYEALTKLIKHQVQDKETLTVVVSEKSYDLWQFKDSKKSKLYKSILQLVGKFKENLKIEEPLITHDLEYEFFSNLFKLPKNEKIVGNYSCMRKGMFGRITITNHYFCYHNHITFATEKYEWSEVSDIKKINSLFTSGIQVLIRNQRMKFTSFHQRDVSFDVITETKTKST